MRIRIGTFNTENLFARFKFRENLTYTHPWRDKWTVDATQIVPFSDFKHRIKAQALGAMQADIVGLQEVEGMDTLKSFIRQFEQYLPAGGYPYPLVIDGNDRRLIDVGLLSRFPIRCIRTHQYDRTAKGQFIFSRDCLEADIALPNGKTLTVFVNHFKSMHEGRNETMAIRKAQATRVLEILQERFGEDPGNALWVVLGDFNDYLPSTGLEPLLSQPWLENVLDRLPPAERWTHYYAGGNEYHPLDYLLLSRSLALANPQAKPELERRGMPKRAQHVQQERFSGVGFNHPKASDHCPLTLEIEI